MTQSNEEKTDQKWAVFAETTTLSEAPSNYRLKTRLAPHEYTTMDTAVAWGENDEGEAELKKHFISNDNHLTITNRSAAGTVSVPRGLFTPEELRNEGYDVTIINRGREGLRDDRAILGGSTGISMREGPQLTAYEKWRDTELKSGLMVLGTGKGKTILAIKLAADLARPFYVFVHEGGLLHQWIFEIKDKLGFEDWDIGICQGSFKKWQWKNKKASIVMLDSLYSQATKGHVAPEFFSHPSTVIYDEAHYLGSRTRFFASELFPCRRILLTATPERGGFESVFSCISGGVIHEDRETDLNPRIYFHPVGTKTGVEIPKGLDKYSRLLKYCEGTANSLGNEAYVDAICKLIREKREEGRCQYVGGKRLVFLEELHRRIEGSSIITGKVDMSKRQEALMDSDVTIVNLKIGKEALNRRALDTAILPHPFGKSKSGKSSLDQFVGRILRNPEDGKDKKAPELHMFYPFHQLANAYVRYAYDYMKEKGWEVVTPPVYHKTKAERSRRKPPKRANLRNNKRGNLWRTVKKRKSLKRRNLKKRQS